MFNPESVLAGRQSQSRDSRVPWDRQPRGCVRTGESSGATQPALVLPPESSHLPESSVLFLQNESLRRLPQDVCVTERTGEAARALPPAGCVPRTRRERALTCPRVSGERYAHACAPRFRGVTRISLPLARRRPRPRAPQVQSCCA